MCTPECTNSLACFLCNIALAYYLKIRNIFESLSLSLLGGAAEEIICVLWIPVSYKSVVMKPVSRKILLNCFLIGASAFIIIYLSSNIILKDTCFHVWNIIEPKTKYVNNYIFYCVK